jgi:hypothetical protein
MTVAVRRVTGKRTHALCQRPAIAPDQSEPRMVTHPIAFDGMSLRPDEYVDRDDDGNEYGVECILAEMWQDVWDVDPVGAATKYLTKWEGYPLEE